jgi:putative Ca2+/H+ antiporter (TMEM165/GDT1 family)
MAGWILVPDKLDNESSATSRYGAFLTTLVIFFLAEIGDKTQIATVVLAARFPDLLMVIAGTTLGMMAANVPVVLAAEAIADRLPVKLIRQITALIFALLGGWILTGIGQ